MDDASVPLVKLTTVTNQAFFQFLAYGCGTACQMM